MQQNFTFSPFFILDMHAYELAVVSLSATALLCKNLRYDGDPAASDNNLVLVKSGS